MNLRAIANVILIIVMVAVLIGFCLLVVQLGIGVMFWQSLGRLEDKRAHSWCQDLNYVTEIRQVLCKDIRVADTVTRERIAGLEMIRVSHPVIWQGAGSEIILLQYKGSYIGRFNLNTPDWNHGISYGEEANFIAAATDRYIYFMFEAPTKNRESYELFRFDIKDSLLTRAWLPLTLGYPVIEIDPAQNLIILEDKIQSIKMPEFQPLYFKRDDDKLDYRFDFNSDGVGDRTDFNTENGLYNGEIQLCSNNAVTCVGTDIYIHSAKEIRPIEQGWLIKYGENTQYYKRLVWENDRLIESGY